MKKMIMECIDKFYYMEFCSLIESHIKELRDSNIVIFGAGIMGLQLSYVLEKYGLHVYAFSDNNSAKWGEKWGGFSIIEPQQLNKINGIFVFLAMEKFDECRQQLETIGLVQNKNLLVVAEKVARKYVRDFYNKNEANTLIFGDCTLNVVSLQEEEQESLFEKFDRDMDIKVLAQNGTYMRFYYNVLQMCIANMHNLKKVLLMFSVDIFSNQYHMLPANQHKDILDAICPVRQEEFGELSDFLKEVEIRNKSTAINFSAPNRSIENVEMISRELRNHTMINYLYRMKKDNESLEYLRKFIHLCHVREIECVCVLMPVNYETGLNLFSVDFIEKYEKNKAQICDVIVKEKGFFCDFSYQLRKEQFMENRSSNEGILSGGRRELFDRVKSYL